MIRAISGRICAHMKSYFHAQKITLAFMIAALIIGACSKNANTETTGTLPPPLVEISKTLPTVETEVPPTPVITKTDEVMPSAPENRTHYELHLILNYYTHFGTVDQIITYTNKTSQSMGEIMLAIPPKYYADSFILRSITGADGQTILPTRADGVEILVQLPEPLQPGQKTIINIQYQLNLQNHEGTFGISGRQTNLYNWYPYIPPYNNETGWIVHSMQVDNGMQVGEYVVNEISDFDVTLQLTDRQELIEIAASAPGIEKDGVWSYHLELARGFAFSISDSYVEYEIEVDGVRIRSYCFHQHIPAGEAVTKLAAKALKLFGELYFPYPREMLSIVAADFLHNMEMDGMVMISYGVFDFYDGPKTNLEMLTPHEVSHQWFYSLIANDQATDPWLDEALATYHEVLYYSRYNPELVQWWWNNRVIGFEPKGYVDSDIYIPGGYPKYRDAVYLRGAMFIQELRDAIGDKAFFESLKDYAITNLYSIATRDSFFAAISSHSQVDITPVLSKYFNQY